MYPDWPDAVAHADLPPLPECPGPKLKPFDFKGPQNIEFLENVGEGLHAIVLKIRIGGQIYALKVFRFVWDNNWTGPREFIRDEDDPKDYIDPEDVEGMSAVYNYSEPFNAECRAFGRLQETNHEELAIRCHGYVLLDQENEAAMMAKCNLDKWRFNGDGDFCGYEEGEVENRLRFVGEKGRPPPFRCIVKDFGAVIDDEEETSPHFSQRTARQMLQVTIKLHKLGIIDHDARICNLVDEKFSDFSTAITTPHFMTSPELNPKLTPAMVEAMRKATFESCVNDYLILDSEVFEWNRDYAKTRGRISIEAYPGGQRMHHNARHDLRNQAFKNRLYTFADPRKYDWTACAIKAAPTSKRRGPGRIAKVVKPRPGQSKGSKSRLRQLTASPDMWYYDYQERDEKWAALTRRSRGTIPHGLRWNYADGGIYPVLRGHKLDWSPDAEVPTRSKEGFKTTITTADGFPRYMVLP